MLSSSFALWLTSAILGFSGVADAASCPSFGQYAEQRHEPFSTGKFKLPYQRPAEDCRTYKSQIVEDTIEKYKTIIKDPDLYRLFENAFPNTLDTAVKWKGYAANSTTEELAFLITGDIDAMWLRDSANQVQSYKTLLTASNDDHSLASLFRGVINLQARYILEAPYCNSFQPPVESKIAPADSGTAHTSPPTDHNTVFECKYELDSLAAFLQVSTDYAEATKDNAFFGKFQWVKAVEKILEVTDGLKISTYSADGSVNRVPYMYTNQATTGTEVQTNQGWGNPFANGTGLIRSFFRPSDDSTIYQGFIPANMQFARYLKTASDIAKAIGNQKLSQRLGSEADALRAAITKNGIVEHEKHGKIYAFEVDGYGGRNIMDDANIPSLLSAAFFGYTDTKDPVYQATRKLVLSEDNPYFSKGSVINSVGSPHTGLGTAWPMASIVRILTSNDDAEITQALKEIVSSTDGLGLIHESISASNEKVWTRSWFSWANGLFGQALIDLHARKPALLEKSFQ